jgi:hypothetical protein
VVVVGVEVAVGTLLVVAGGVVAFVLESKSSDLDTGVVVDTTGGTAGVIGVGLGTLPVVPVVTAGVGLVLGTLSVVGVVTFVLESKSSDLGSVTMGVVGTTGGVVAVTGGVTVTGVGVTTGAGATKVA